MCDTAKYEAIFHEINKLSPDDTLELILNSESDEEKEFYEMLGDYLLQKRQRKIIEGNIF